MNFDDDLRAPVWDELDVYKPTSHEELTKSFADLNVNDEVDEIKPDEEVIDQENTSKETPDTAYSSAFELHNSVDLTKSFWGGGERGQLKTDSKLINTLAPENDLLSDLTVSKKENEVKSSNDALFEGSVCFPLIFDGNNDDADDTEPGSHNIMKEKGKSNIISQKSNVLFNSARLRRRPMASSHRRNQKTGKLLSDPLTDISNSNEFVDESLEEEVNILSKNIQANIFTQVEQPLFYISKSEKTILEGGKKVTTINGTQNKDQNSEVTNEITYEPDNLILNEYDIEVKDPVKIRDLTSMHVEYAVSAKSEALEGNFSQVNRRYTDFRWLYRQLQSNHWGKIIPPPPEKQAVGRFKNDFLENRRFQMERMLIKIAQDPILQKDIDFIMFLTSLNFNFNSKTREHYSGSNASNDSNDLSDIHISEIELLGEDDAAIVMKNGGIDGEQNRSFMSISFSSLPTYEEQDEYFLRQQQFFEILEEQLTQLDKSMELVETERNELSFVTEEFSNTIETLAKLEITKAGSNILSNFSEVHRKIRESLERISSEESLTLGVNLDEYIRSITSVRAIFKQRSKLGYYMNVVESNFMKNQSQLEKMEQNSISSNNLEKLKNLKVQSDILKKRFQIIKSKWQQVGDKIKVEIKNFEKDKIDEFRNNIEIFLASSIEAQKECIETWETFYQNNISI